MISQTSKELPKPQLAYRFAGYEFKPYAYVLVNPNGGRVLLDEIEVNSLMLLIEHRGRLLSWEYLEFQLKTLRNKRPIYNLQELFQSSPTKAPIIQIYEGGVIFDSKVSFHLEPTEADQPDQSGNYIDLLQQVSQSKIGVHFTHTDTELIIISAANAGDEAAARDRIVCGLHSEVLRKAELLLAHTSRLNNQYAWAELGPTLQRFRSSLSEGTLKVAEQIGEVWSCIVELGTYLELDQRLAVEDWHNTPPLDPEVRRIFVDFIQTAAPFVRKFPSARELDDESGAFLRRTNSLVAANELVATAAQARLVDPAVQGLIQRLTAAAERGNTQGAKAEQRAIGTAKNLVIYAATILVSIYAGAVGQVLSNSSIVAKKAADVIIGSEGQLQLLLEDMPNDLRSAFRSLVERLRGDPNYPSGDHSGTDPAILPSDYRRRGS